jgi:hypothetical protein
MSTAVLSLENLAQQIQQQEDALARLRRAYETRQTQLADLTRRKTELQAKLNQVEAEIKLIAKDAGTAPIPTAAATKPTKPASVKAARGISLPKLLVDILRHANRPLAAKELADAVLRRKYPTTSNNLQAIVETRVGDLVRKGILKRATDQPGVMLGKSGSQSADSKGRTTVAKTASPTQGQKKKSLKVVITEVLASSPRPLTTEELAKKVLATGYKTTSKNFLNVLWVGIGDMDNVERVADGYRLKKSGNKK